MPFKIAWNPGRLATLAPLLSRSRITSTTSQPLISGSSRHFSSWTSGLTVILAALC